MTVAVPWVPAAPEEYVSVVVAVLFPDPEESGVTTVGLSVHVAIPVLGHEDNVRAIGVSARLEFVIVNS